MQENQDRRDQNNEGGGDKSIEGGKRQTRRIFLWILCGGYLLYLAYQLGSGLRSGETAAGAERVISIIACVAFTIIAVVLLISAVRLWARSFRDSVQAMREEPDKPELPEGAGEEEQEEE